MADDRALLEEIHRLRDQLAAPPSWQGPALCFDPGALPPLPEICNESLRRQVFLHRGSYERLEGFGDRIINSQSYAVLHRTFAGAPPSSIGNISAKFTCNRTISYLSLAYGLPDRLSYSGGQNLVANQLLGWHAAKHLGPTRPEGGELRQGGPTASYGKRG